MAQDKSDFTRDGALSRRAMLGRLAGALAGVAGAACTPMRIVLKIYPDAFEDPAVIERYLHAFMRAVVPGASADEPYLTWSLRDPAFPMAKHVAFLCADLSDRAGRLFAQPAFDALDVESRTTVIHDGIAGGGLTARLYQGAIYIGQIGFYAGIYDDGRGCPSIDFPGRYRFEGLRATTYPDCERFLGHSITSDGNPV